MREQDVFAEAYLKGLESTGVIVPGAAAEIQKNIADRTRLSTPVETLASVVEFVNRQGSKYKDPSSDPPPELAVKSFSNALAAGGLIKAESVDEIVRALAVKTAGRPAAQVAREVAYLLSESDNRRLLVEDDQPLDYYERKTLASLRLFKLDLGDGVDIDKLAKDWKNLGRDHLSGPGLNRAVASFIVGARLAEPFEPGDWRFAAGQGVGPKPVAAF